MLKVQTAEHNVQRKMEKWPISSPPAKAGGWQTFAATRLKQFIPGFARQLGEIGVYDHHYVSV
jgi:hypothetical protein